MSSQHASSPTHNPMAVSSAQPFFSVALAVLIGVIAYVGRSVLIPFVIAAFICFLIFSLRESVSRIPAIGKHLPGWLSYLLAFAIIIMAFVIFIAIIRSNVGELLRVWPEYETRLKDIAGQGLNWFRSLDFLPPELVGSMTEIKDAAFSMVTPALRQAVGSLGGLTSNMLTLGTVLFYMAFMLIERGRIFRKIGLISAVRNQEHAVNETINDIAILVRQYISVKTITNLVTAVTMYIIMRIAGVNSAGFWALLIFVFNFIPIFGAALAILLPVSLMIVQPGGGLVNALILLGFMIGAEQTMSSVIEPRLIGRTLNLSPLVILFSLAVWGSLWGFTGILLAIPMTITVMIIMTQFHVTRPVAILLSDNGDIAEMKHADSTRTAMALESTQKNKQEPPQQSPA